MISLRNAIAQQREELLHSALDCCRAMVSAVAESVARVSGASAAGDFSRTEEEIGRELEGWCTRASEYYRRKASEIRDVMVAMNEAAKSVADRDERHALHATAQVDRTGLEDGRQSVACLKTQLAAYEQRLEEAERASNADALTGLLIRAGTPFCMVVFDLNGFKEINDTHGHPADDALLKAFAKEFRGQFRALDVVGRWGGDEFVVLLNGPAADARIRVDGVHRWVFGEYPLRGGARVTIDAAVGMTVFRRGFIYVL